jgi:hypothetical protein
MRRKDYSAKKIGQQDLTGWGLYLGNSGHLPDIGPYAEAGQARHFDLSLRDTSGFPLLGNDAEAALCEVGCWASELELLGKGERHCLLSNGVRGCGGWI